PGRRSAGRARHELQAANRGVYPPNSGIQEERRASLWRRGQVAPTAKEPVCLPVERMAGIENSYLWDGLGLPAIGLTRAAELAHLRHDVDEGVVQVALTTGRIGDLETTTLSQNHSGLLLELGGWFVHVSGGVV